MSIGPEYLLKELRMNVTSSNIHIYYVKFFSSYTNEEGDGVQDFFLYS
jgi:hypothetical protein